MKQAKVYIYGKHAVSEALMHARSAVLKVFADTRALDPGLRAIVGSSGVVVEPLSSGMARADLKAGSAHQNVIAQISVFNLSRRYEDFMRELAVTPATCLVVLAGVQDPHNTGAIIRSAAGFGASGVLMPQKAQSPITSAVIKVSAGMAFRVPLVSIEDSEKAVYDLKKRGFKIYALAGEGKKSIVDEPFDGPTALVMGNEGEGIPRSLRVLCDAVLKVPISPRAESLNVAAAAAVSLFQWSVRHPEALLA
ncbi:MAG TPA: 23S rRNA (guanosine(2251)-2'-O)-methyltransferase RlmB [Candidatus Paceibacterota bacterium]|nr:23S rRNA (guanosine(2251)-2'-O)-methyltransferase RlmB [Candidatus Paceibacterota bacterium]